MGLVRGSIREGTSVSVLVSLGREVREGIDVSIQLAFVLGAV